MKVKHWVLTVAAILVMFTATSALAGGLCGERFNLGRGPQLTVLGLMADQRLVQPRALTWIVVGDLAKIEAKVRRLGFGEVKILDADGNEVKP